MTRHLLPLGILGLACALGGCNETNGGPGPVVSAPIGPTAYKLPPGADCTAEINKYQVVLKADLDSGNVAQSVYDAIQRDLTRAASACEAGRESEARSIIAATKVKHGYKA